MSDLKNYRCSRCQHTACEAGEIYAAGGMWQRMLDMELAHLSTVTCKRCRHTEFFKADKDSLSSIFDLFVAQNTKDRI